MTRMTRTLRPLTLIAALALSSAAFAGGTHAGGHGHDSDETAIGKPGVAVAAITRRPAGFVVAHVDGAESPTVNGTPIQADPVFLKNGDLLELAGIQMQFVQA